MSSKKYSKIIDHTHIFIPKAELVRPVNELRGMFTVRSKFDPDVSCTIYRETKDYFGVPRYYLSDPKLFADEYVDKRADGFSVKFNVIHEPRERQVPVLESFRKKFDAGKTGFILSAPTGTGKTFMMLYMLSVIGRNALVIVPREYIVDQWIEMIRKHTDIPDDKIGVVQQNRCDFEGKWITVGMLHSIAMRDYGKQFKQAFGVVVWDEVHTVATEVFSRTVNILPARYRIGASATPRRKDGMDAVFKLSIGECYLSVDGVPDLVPKVVVQEYRTPLPLPRGLRYAKDAKSRYGVITSFIAEDAVRNNLIAYYICKLRESGRRVLMLTDRKSQISDVFANLTHRFGVQHVDVGIFTGSTPKISRQSIIKTSPIILATYGVMRMAVDAPDLDGLVFGTPVSDAEQAVGRILRKKSGKKRPVVVDIVDTKLEDTIKWAEKRFALYDRFGADIVKVVGVDLEQESATA